MAPVGYWPVSGRLGFARSSNVTVCGPPCGTAVAVGTPVTSPLTSAVNFTPSSTAFVSPTLDGLAGVAEPGQIVQGQPGEGGLVGAAVLVGTGVLVGAGVLVEVGRGVAVGADEVNTT